MRTDATNAYRGRSIEVLLMDLELYPWLILTVKINKQINKLYFQHSWKASFPPSPLADHSKAAPLVIWAVFPVAANC